MCANPQLENGYTQIANEIIEHLVKMHLSSNQWQVLLCIIRKTYGYHKKVDYIANYQIVGATGLCKAVVSRALRNLTDKKVIDRREKYISFQKDWEKWEGWLAEQLTNEKLAILHDKLAIRSSKLAISSTKVSRTATQQKIKDTLTKNTLQKIPKKAYGEFTNVLLTEQEYRKLEDKFGAGVSDRIEALSLGIESKGYKYKSHYATILSWEQKDRKERRDGGMGYRGGGIPGNQPAGAFDDLIAKDGKV